MKNKEICKKIDEQLPVGGVAMNDLDRLTLENEQLKNMVTFLKSVIEMNSVVEVRTVTSTDAAVEETASCDICGCHPTIIINTANGRFCQKHYFEMNNLH